MTPLGKPLVFYLKYMAEMNHLYAELEEGEERDMTGVEDAEHVLEMARTVGDAACEHVADFLVLCGRRIEDHFTSLKIATLDKKRTRAFVKNYWDWGARVHVSSVSGGWFSCGAFVSAPPEVHISMEKDACGVVVPWLWSEGGRKGADAIWKVVGSWADSRAGEGLVFERATVALARIPIKAQPPESFQVDRDHLIAEVMKIIARIGAEEATAIANSVAGLKESGEE